jgi:hypothetical protein
MWALKAFNRTTGAVVDAKSYVTVQESLPYVTYFPFIWKNTDALPCKGIAQFSLMKDPYNPVDPPAAANAPFCCDGVPATIYAYPLS